MKISYNWLKQFIKTDWDAEKTGELLTDLGLEVEGITPYESVKGGLKGIVVGHVLTCEKHPDADKLKITTVDIGADSPLQIVCGAPNVAAGQKVPVATIGTTLYTAEGEAWQIKKGKIRGLESHGMICAEDELGLGSSHDGIMVLANDLMVGTPCATIFEIENDEVFEIGLTPNRADAMSHFGVARDLKAGLKQKEIPKELITPSVSNFSIANRALKIPVEVKDTELAPRYCGVTISNLTVQESPDWLKNRLKSIGLSPINNIVDATNYVLHELGQPLHAFDAGKIAGNKILVQRVAKGTKFTTLDGIERELHDEDLMICDAEKPMCIAGVFGGEFSGVNEHTTAIFLESAYFNPVSVRKTAKRHGLNTDASFRFERGIDINNVEYCLKRAANLIIEIAGGEITSDVVDLYPKRKDDYQVFLTFEKINNLIGEALPTDTIKSILSSLEIKINNVSESGLGLTIPYYRVDVQREVDVIEEILRVYGYNNIGYKTKLNASIANVSKFEDYKVQNVVADVLTANGFYEIMTNSLTTPDYEALSETVNKFHNVEILNPLSTDLSVLRQSMLFSGLEAISYNYNRKQQNLSFFEFGKTYKNQQGSRNEHKHLSVFITGSKADQDWTTATTKTGFFDLRAHVNTILTRLGITNVTAEAVKTDVFSEGITLNHKSTPLVVFGVLKKGITKHFDIKQDVFYADFNWENVLTIAANNSIVFKEIPKFPAVKRDLALLLDEHISFQEIEAIAYKTDKKLLKEISLFDVYTGDKLPEGKKSYAVSFTIQDEKSTLTEKQIEKLMNKLQKSYAYQLGAELR